MSDLIRRQDAIDALYREIIKRRLLDEMYDGALDEFQTEEILRKLPPAQPEPQWIPVSERLPEIGKEVLLSEPNAMFVAVYFGSGNPKGLWLVDGRHHFLVDVNGCAWCELPEPYAERRAE